MGLLNAMLARHCGAARIVISEILSRRLELARQFDFDLVVDSAQEDMAGRVMQFTGGVGADVAIVAAPEAAPQESAVRLVRKRGTVCLFASLPVEHRTLRIDSRPIHYGELRLVGTSDSSAAHLARAVQLLAAGAIPMERLITHVLPLDGIHAAFDLMATGQSLRVVLRP